VTVRESWLQTRDRLEAADVVDAGLEAEVLLRHVLGIDRAEYFASLERPVALPEQDLADTLAERRVAGEPLAYIFGRREFYGHELGVGPGVLVPRQETELLVDVALEFVSTRNLRRPLIADVGTGSGAIAIAVAKALPDATVYATDISHDALKIAEANVLAHDVQDAVHLLQGDLLEPLPGPVDIVVSNPPYLTTDELLGLSSEVRREPETALDGGCDGLSAISELMRQAAGLVQKPRLLAVEIAPSQLESVVLLAQGLFPDSQVTHLLDLAGLPRVVHVLLSDHSAGKNIV
jgi:release factor glutamine methyltransferase